MLFAFLDTSALHRAYLLRGAQWDSVAQAVALGVARVAVSDVTVLELQRQALEDSRELDKRIRGVAEDASRFGARVTAQPLSLTAQGWSESFRQRLNECRIEIIPHAQPPHAELIARDLHGSPPFKASGEGYRDALIWLTFLEWLDDAAPSEGDTVVFVSANTRQFCAPNTTSLEPTLMREVRDICAVEVALVPDRRSFVETARALASEAATVALPETPNLGERAIEQEVRAAVEDLAGTDFDILGHPQVRGVRVINEFELPTIHSATVHSAEIIGDVIDSFPVDTFDETTELWQAVCNVIFWVGGGMHRRDLPTLPPAAYVNSYSYADTLVDVEFPLSVKLTYDVRLEPAGATSAELVEVAVLPPDGWVWGVEMAIQERPIADVATRKTRSAKHDTQ